MAERDMHNYPCLILVLVMAILHLLTDLRRLSPVMGSPLGGALREEIQVFSVQHFQGLFKLIKPELSELLVLVLKTIEKENFACVNMGEQSESGNLY